MGGASPIRKAACVSLAAVLLILSYRTALSYLLTLSPSAARPAEKLPDESRQLVARDRLPKPSRQQERTATERPCQGKPSSRPSSLPPSPLDLRSDDLQPAGLSGGASADDRLAEATKPSYLRPNQSVPRGQIPPPA